MFCNAYIQPHFNYCNVIWGNSSNYNLSRGTQLQKLAFKIILGNEYLNLKKMRLNILSFEQSVFANKVNIMLRVANSLISQYGCDLFQRRLDHSLHASLRSVSRQIFRIPNPNLSIFKDSISYLGPIIWNSIPNEIKNSSTCSSFIQKIISWLKNLNKGNISVRK